MILIIKKDMCNWNVFYYKVPLASHYLYCKPTFRLFLWWPSVCTFAKGHLFSFNWLTEWLHFKGSKSNIKIRISSWKDLPQQLFWLIPSPFGFKTNYQWINDHIRPMNQDQLYYCQVGVQFCYLQIRSQFPFMSLFLHYASKSGLLEGVNLHFFLIFTMKAIHQDLLTDDEFSLKKNKIQCQRSH